MTTPPAARRSDLNPLPASIRSVPSESRAASRRGIVVGPRAFQSAALAQ